jgi:hypothetical protein
MADKRPDPIQLKSDVVALKHKMKRFITSMLPIDANRQGECNRCGECCKLPYPCPFLRYDAEGLSTCSVYFARPPSCRKYPRTADENVTPEQCGYYFVDVSSIARRRATAPQRGG